MQILKAEPLTRKAFAPFGDVIQADDDVRHFPINNGTTMRYHDLAEVQLRGSDAHAIISIFRGQPFGLPVDLHMLERHPSGSQAFIPMHGDRFLIAVAPPGEDLDVSSVRAFFTDGRQGVNYHAGVWHHPLISLDRESDFLVVDRAGEGSNCDERDLPEPIRLYGP